MATCDDTLREGHDGAGTLTARIGAHTWRLRCEKGQEHALISALVDLARRDDAPLSWIDAASLFCRLSRPNTTTDGTRRADAPRGDSSRPSAESTRSTTTS